MPRKLLRRPIDVRSRKNYETETLTLYVNVREAIVVGVGVEVAVGAVELEVEIMIEDRHAIHDPHHQDVGIRQIETAIVGHHQGGI